MARLRRSRLALAALALLVGGTGCAARRGRTDRVAFEGSRAAERLAAERDLAGRRGYASFGSGVRLRDDTPMLTPLLEASRAAAEPAPSYGPRGAEGERPGGVTWADPYPTYGTGYGYGYGYGYPGNPGGVPYLAPGDAVWPGLRPVPPQEVTSPFAAPFQAPAGSDVSRHRPGLSTGTGVYGRDAGR